MSKKVTSAGAILDMEFGADPEYQKAVADEYVNGMISREIITLRKESGLTQKQLAELIGTKQTAISRLESADYEGHSFAMLLKISTALHKRIEFRFVSDGFANETTDARPATRQAGELAVA